MKEQLVKVNVNEKVVIFAETNPLLIKEARRLSTRKTIGAAKSETIDDDEYYYNLLRVSIRKINDESVDYSKLEGEKFFDYFTFKEIMLLIAGVVKVSTISNDEMESFLSTITPVPLDS